MPEQDSAAPVRLAVLGSPIAHSRSPQLHRAAYAALGLDWSYTREEVREDELADFLAGLGPGWRGLSLTMPLKRRVAELVPQVDAVAARTRQGNTILLRGGAPVAAFNTDVHGVTAAFAGAGVRAPVRAMVLGGGATAESAAVALGDLGAEVVVAVRDVAKVRASGAFAGGVRIVPFDDRATEELGRADAVVSTIPPGADFTLTLPALAPGATLLDVAYHPWPTRLAFEWRQAGGEIVHGLEMLVHQAVHQVRVFVGGDPSVPLPDEPRIIRAMRSAVE